MKIGSRLGLGFGVILTLMVVTTAVSLWRLQTVAETTRQMMQEPLAKERLIGDWYRNIAAGVRRTTAIAKSSDASLTTFFAADAAASTKGSGEMQKKIEALITGTEEKALFDKVSEQRKQYLSTRDAITKAKAAGQTAEVDTLLAQFTPVADAYQKIISDLLEHQRRALDQGAAEIETLAGTSRTLLITLAVVSTLLGAILAWYLTVGITRPLLAASRIARQVADGDPSTHIAVTSKDETGVLLQALKDMHDSLVRIVGEVRTGTDTMTTATAEIASGNMDLSARTEEQANSLGTTAATMEELTSTVKQNADNARQANQLAMTASQVAVRGGTVVAQVVDTMASINASSNKIVDIIAVIDSIAFQTNILALNAAVEAARAGEQGRGFAVVASEVRNLAQRSAAAAKEIKTLIGDSVEKVDAGGKLVSAAGTTMTDIVDSVRRVTDIMGEIVAASQEQSSGIEQVNLAIAQMDDATQQNAALVEQAAAASQSLQEQAAQLSQVVAVFKLEGSAAASNSVLTAPRRATAAAPVRRAAPSIAPARRVAAPARTVAAGSPRVLGAASPATTASGGDWEEF